MILYKPTDGDVQLTKIEYRPNTCFIMTQIGKPVPVNIQNIRSKLTKYLKKIKMNQLDAGDIVTGKDFLLKIWKVIVSVPLGIAIIDENMSPNTLCNIFYEIGIMQSLGKETVVIKTEKANVPSDFVRTEYIKYDKDFNKNLKKYFSTYSELAKYYETFADQLDRNPLLAIDYIRRAYLINGESRLKEKAKKIHRDASIGGRAMNSVEQLLVDF